MIFSSLKMALATFSSRILGLVRELSMAAIFGASGYTDAFLVAYRIPNLLRDLFAEGAFSSAFVPVFSEEKIRGENYSRSLLWSLFLVLLLITGIITGLTIIFAPELTSMFAPSFKQDMEKFNLTVLLVRIMSPFLTMVSLAALFMGALNSLKVFFVPSFAPACFNIIMILSIYFLPSYFYPYGGDGIVALAVGVVGGGIIQMLVQFPYLLKKKFGPKGPINLKSPAVKKVLKRVSIGLIGFAATQINLLITTILATGTIVGAVSWLSYAFRLFQFPVGIFSVSLAGSNLVHFSEAIKNNKQQQAIDSLKSTYDLSFIIILPSLALLYAFSGQVVHLIFERGAFDPNDSAMTAMALRYYLWGLPFYGLYKIFGPIFFALDKPKTPVIISIFSIFLNIIFCITLTPKYGFKILALGTSLSMMVNCLLQAIFIKRELKLSLSFFFSFRIFKMLLSTGLTYYLVQKLEAQYFSYADSFVVKASVIALLGALGYSVYGIVLVIFGESKSLKNTFNQMKKAKK
ncbi:MAG: murein biosynthesis integral membrane protein MurJ [Bacteriovoracaceae bacterium]